jgi:two-component system invasion response regulator UvrY
MMRVLIADDHAIVRTGVKGILSREFEAVICGEAENADQLIAELEAGDWDLVILDVSMPGRSGFDVLRQLKAVRPNLPILVLSMHAEAQYGKRMLRAGASGYMNKEIAAEELVTAVRHILSGHRYVSPALAETLARDFDESVPRPPHERLSDREFEVLRQIASGRTVSQIAEDLRLSTPTVSTYRARILEKMGLVTNAELIRYAIQHRIVE